MKVSELIEQLSKCDPDAKVCKMAWEDSVWQEIKIVYKELTVEVDGKLWETNEHIVKTYKLDAFDIIVIS